MTEANSRQADSTIAEASECYLSREGVIVHELTVGELDIEAEVASSSAQQDAKSSWWQSYLAGEVPRPIRPIGGRIRAVDLFCGPGGLANGVRQLCQELGISLVTDLIVDQDEEATLVYAANHATRQRSTASVKSLVDYTVSRTADAVTFAYKPELVDSNLTKGLGNVDLVLAGPPCQGHSNLNNQTRRSDPRNDLYLSVPALAVAVGAQMCIIENVPAVLNDANRVVETAQRLFESEGYMVSTGRLSASEMGWPQSRMRHFLVARRDRPPIPFEEIRSVLRDDPRSLWWAIADLEDEVGDDIIRQVSELSERNRARIDWLFENDEYELALAERPKCHRGGTTYTAVYGRLRKDRPAPTITTGFMSPGRGRYTHPTRRRALTAHEAARLQGFPDNYRFVVDPSNPPGRTQLAKWIGDAVPMPLGYAAALSAFGGAFSEV